MASKEFSIYNKTRESSVTTSIPVIDSAREPLAALRAMVEGLGTENAAGLWLTHVTSFPMVPRLSPFDLVYLDKDHCVVERFELLPAADMPRFKSPASSALILPFQTISAVRIDAGDEFLIDELGAGESPVPAESGAPEALVEPTKTPSGGAGADRTASSIAPRGSCSLTIREAPAPECPAETDEKSATIRPGQAEREQGFSRRGRRKKRRNRQALKPVISAGANGHATASPAAAPVESRASGPELAESAAVLERSPSLFASLVPLDLDILRVSEAAPAASEIPDPAGAGDSLPSESQDAAGDRAPATEIRLESEDIATTSIPQNAAPEVAVELPVPGQDCALVPVERRGSESTNSHAAGNGRPGNRSDKSETGPRADRNQANDAERKPVVQRILSWLYPSLCKQERRHAERRPLEGLVAYEQSSEGPRKMDIGNISSSGIYLLTEQKWNPGEVISLSLQRSGPFERAPERRIDLHADPVRCGSDGIGLSFVWPEGMDLRLWDSPVVTNVYEAEPDYIVREMRMARALAFLRRICPAAADQARILLHTVLSNVRVANAVEIALKAERLLMGEPNAQSLLAHPELIIRILEDGSWVDVDSIQQLWAGLLATSCTIEGQDESNRVYINLLSLLAPIHTRILSAACGKAVKVMADVEVEASPHLVACSPEEMAQLTGSSNLVKVHRSIAELSELGLLERTAKASVRSVSSVTRSRPTPLGLEMYARCNGQRGAA